MPLRTLFSNAFQPSGRWIAVGNWADVVLWPSRAGGTPTQGPPSAPIYTSKGAVMAYQFYLSIKGTKQGQIKASPTKTRTSAGSSVPGYSPQEIFEIDDFSFDIEQVLNIGSQSSGAGSGKVTFNPFQITKKTDSASPQLFASCITGEAFESVVLQIFESGKRGTETLMNTITLTNASILSVIAYSIKHKLSHKFSFGFEKISVDFMTPALVALSRE
jgi:type VI secretion system Hcp family effector